MRLQKKPDVRSVIDENQDGSAIRVTLENGYEFRQLPGVSIIKVGSISVARNLMAPGEIRRKIEILQHLRRQTCRNCAVHRLARWKSYL